MKCKPLFALLFLALGFSSKTLFCQDISFVPASPATPNTLSTTVADFTFTAASCTPSAPCFSSAPCIAPVCSTAFFILYGDGTYDSGTGTVLTRTHKYPTAGASYVANAFFVKKKDVDPPALISTPVTAGSGGSFTNPPAQMYGKNVKVSTSWLPVTGQQHFVVLTIANTCNDWPSGTLEFYYNASKIEVNTGGFANFNASGSPTVSWVSSPTGTSVFNKKCVLSYTGLTGGTQKHFFVPVDVQSLPPGTAINYKAILKPAKFYCSDLNMDELSKTTGLAAHDPNTKTVNIESICTNSPATTLEYHITFQNDGAAFAGPIVVTDLLDPNLVEPLSVIVTGFSHTCQYSPDPSNSNLATFTFPNIELPGTNQTSPEKYDYSDCIGEFWFTVNTLPNLSPGIIPNVADVIFYPDGSTLQTDVANVAVIAPTQENPDCEPRERGNSILKNPSVQIKVAAVPNPFSNSLSIISKALPLGENALVQILDISGQVIAQQIVAAGFEWNLSSAAWPAGIYFIRLQSEKETTVQRVVKQ